MLSTPAATWPAQGDWMMERKWDGFRLLVEIGDHARIRAWSRRGTSLGDRLGSLLAPLAEASRGTVFDAELVALSSHESASSASCSGIGPGRGVVDDRFWLQAVERLLATGPARSEHVQADSGEDHRQPPPEAVDLLGVGPLQP